MGVASKRGKPGGGGPAASAIKDAYLQGPQ